MPQWLVLGGALAHDSKRAVPFTRAVAGGFDGMLGLKAYSTERTRRLVDFISVCSKLFTFLLSSLLADAIVTYLRIVVPSFSSMQRVIYRCQADSYTYLS